MWHVNREESEMSTSSTNRRKFIEQNKPEVTMKRPKRLKKKNRRMRKNSYKAFEPKSCEWLSWYLVEIIK